LETRGLYRTKCSSTASFFFFFKVDILHQSGPRHGATVCRIKGYMPFGYQHGRPLPPTETDCDVLQRSFGHNTPYPIPLPFSSSKAFHTRIIESSPLSLLLLAGLEETIVQQQEMGIRSIILFFLRVGTCGTIGNWGVSHPVNRTRRSTRTLTRRCRNSKMDTVNLSTGHVGDFSVRVICRTAYSLRIHCGTKCK
jgi:hypothetical protein